MAGSGRLVALAALFLWCDSPGAAQPRVDRNCSDDRGVDRCSPEQQSRVRELFRVPSIEEHRAAGDQVRRGFYVDGYGRDVVAISFVRARGRDPEVRVHFKREEGVPDHEPIVALVPSETWELLIDRSAHFDRALVTLPRPSDPNVISMCIHSWVYTIEATDPPEREGGAATVRRRTEDACEHGLAQAYATELYQAALSLFPYCARLDASQYRTPANQLAACRLLRGDRSAAAVVLNRSEPLLDQLRTPDSEGIAALFRWNSQVEWNGERSPASGRAAAQFFLSRLSGSHSEFFHIERVEGERSDRVTLFGGLLRQVREPDEQDLRFERASVELVWEPEFREHFLIREARVGPFEPLPIP